MESESTASSVASLHTKIESENKLTPSVRQKLKALYEEAIDTAEKVENIAEPVSLRCRPTDFWFPFAT